MALLIQFGLETEVQELELLITSEFFGEGNGTPLQYSCLEIPWTEESGRLQSMGLLGVGHD